MVKQNSKEEDKKHIVTNNKTLLSQFYNLVSLKEDDRITSSIRIITELKKSQTEDEISYTVERLVKGLASSRKAARQGYATALTQLMIDFDDVTPQKVLDLIADKLSVKGSFKGQEERDNYFGQLFGFIAVYKAQSSCKSVKNHDLTGVIITALLSLGSKKSYLQEVCGKAICDIINEMSYEIYKENAEDALNAVLKFGWKKCSPEFIMIIMTVMKKFKDELPSKYLKEHWGKSDLLNSSNFKHMLPALMETTNLSHPRTHLVFKIILDEILQDGNFERFNKFWKTVVIDGLLKSTHARKFLAINLLLQVVSRISPDEVDLVFDETMLKCFFNSCQSKDNFLYNAVRTVLEKLPLELSNNKQDKIIPIIIKTLVGRYGNFNFDQITKTKTIEKLTTMLSENVTEYTEFLYKTFAAGQLEKDEEIKGASDNVKEEEIHNCRCWVAQQLVTIVKSYKSKVHEELVTDATIFIFIAAHFQLIKPSNKQKMISFQFDHPVTKQTQSYCQQKFNTMLTELSHRQSQFENGNHTSNHILGMTADQQFYAYTILIQIKEFLHLPKYLTLINAWTPEMYETFDLSLKLIENYNNNETKPSTDIKSRQLLLIHSTIQMFTHGEEAAEIIKDLITCFEKSEEKKKKKLSVEEPHWTEVLTEILLGFLAQPSMLMRQIVDIIFPSIVPHITHDAFQMLLHAIKPKVKGENEDVEVEETSDEEKKESDEDTDEQDEIDENGSKKNEDDDDDEQQSSDSESDEDSESDDDEMEIDEKFKLEIKSALGDSVQQSDSESNSDDEDLDMDTCDPKLLDAMDEKLSEIFQAKKMAKQAKKKKKLEKESVQHFKLRVLDLVEILIKKHPKHERVLGLVEPLFVIIKSTHGHTGEQSFFERTLGIYKNRLCQLHEYPTLNDKMADQIHELIELMVEHAKHAMSILMESYISLGISYLIRVLRGSTHTEPSPLKTRNQRKRQSTISNATEIQVADQKNKSFVNEERLTKCFGDALQDFMTNRSCHIQPVLFIEYIQRFPELGWNLAPTIPQYFTVACNNFRKMKAIEMIKHLLSKKVPNQEKLLNEFNSPFLTNVSKVVESASEESCVWKSRQFHDIIHVLDAFIKQKKLHEIPLDEGFQTISKSLEVAMTTTIFSRSQALLSYSRKVLNSMNQPINGENNSPSKKKKKKKKKKI